MRVDNKKVCQASSTNPCSPLYQVVEDDSGMGGFGATIDFTDPRLMRSWARGAKCMDTCKV